MLILPFKKGALEHPFRCERCQAVLLHQPLPGPRRSGAERALRPRCGRGAAAAGAERGGGGGRPAGGRRTGGRRWFLRAAPAPAACALLPLSCQPWEDSAEGGGRKPSARLLVADKFSLQNRAGVSFISHK